MENFKICKECIQPDTRPGVFFNEKGVCGACLWEKEKEKIDWNDRTDELKQIVEDTKKKNELFKIVELQLDSQ